MTRKQLKSFVRRVVEGREAPTRPELRDLADMASRCLHHETPLPALTTRQMKRIAETAVGCMEAKRAFIKRLNDEA